MNYFFYETQKVLWPSQLQWLNDMSIGCRLNIDTASPRQGIRTQELNSPLFNGFTYDSGRDVLYVLTEPLYHIEHPREIAVDISGSVLRSVTVRVQDGVVETISFWHPPRLMAPAETGWSRTEPAYRQPPYRRPTDT